MHRRHVRSILAFSLLLGTSQMVLSSDALARRNLVPELPSVEVNLDVLEALEYRADGAVSSRMPFQRGASEAVRRGAQPNESVRREVGLKPVQPMVNRPPQVNRVMTSPPAAYSPPPQARASVAPAPIRRRPTLNSTPAPITHPMVRPPVQTNMPPATMPERGYAVYEPAPLYGSSLPPVRPVQPIRRASSAAPKVEEKQEEVAEVETQPKTALEAPRQTTVEPNLPEPELDNVAFEDFPELEPLPAATVPKKSSSLPDPELMFDDADQVAPTPSQALPSLNALTGEEAGEIEPPQPPQPMAMPEMPAMPEMQTQEAMPPAPDVMPAETAAELPPMPSFDDVPAAVPPGMPDLPPPTELASLPSAPAPQDAIEMPVDMPAMPAIEMPEPMSTEATVSAPSSLTIEFAETENEIPVSAQGQLASLAEQLVQSGQNVKIQPYVGGTTEESSLANVIGTRRAFAVRTFLIDKGVSHFNISIDRNQVSQEGTPERVELRVK